MAYGPPATAYDPTNVMGRRIGAWCIDILIPIIAVAFVYWIIFLGSATRYTALEPGRCASLTFGHPETVCRQIGQDAYVTSRSDDRRARAVGFLVFLIGAVNLFVVQGLSGAAVGKHMFGLRVVREDGRLVGFGWNALRTLLLVVDQAFCPLIGLVTALVTHPHRRVGDFAAGSYVVGKQSVGVPVASQSGMQGYPPPWSPPPQQWGPPPGASQPWGAQQPGEQPWGAPAAGWGTPGSYQQPGSYQPPASGPPPAATPPAATPPAATPPAWGTPAASPAPNPTAPITEPVADAAGWASPTRQPEPTPQPTPDPTPAAAAPQAAVPTRESQWDAQRNAWVYWEPETSRWLQYDTGTGQWGPLR